MKIRFKEEFINFSYTVPIIVRKNLIKSNTALSLFIFSDDKEIGFIQFASLPYFHNYNIKQWHFFIIDFFNTHSLNFDSIKLDAPLFNMTKADLDGELLFIIEAILLKIIESKKPNFFSIPINTQIKVNQLYSEELTTNNNIECLKIKIRPTLSSQEQSSSIIKSVLANNPSALFRLDGNQSFELHELINFMETLKKTTSLNLEPFIEYIEEPFKNNSNAYLFSQVSNYKIALDESILPFKNKLQDLIINPLEFSFVIKPSLIGISKSFELINLAIKYRRKVVLSSSYEPLSSLHSITVLASLLPDTFHGLDTLKYLPNELCI